jgi:hypothetical protein
MASRPRADPPRKPGLVRESGAQTLLTDAELDANAGAVDAVIKALGGKGQILDTLAIAADAPEVEKVVALLLDPRYDGFSLRRLCQLAGLTVVDLFAAYKKAMVVQAHLLAYQTISARILPVVEDVMRRAAPYEIPCDECGGSAQVAVDAADGSRQTVSCKVCAGQGKLVQLPDLDRQKLALELAQLVQKSAGISIQQNQVVTPPDPEPRDGRGTFIEMQHAIRQMLSGPRQPILDAETLPPEGEP